MLVAHALCGPVQVTRAGVVPEPRPQVQHLIEPGVGERADVREARHEALVVRDDGRDLRLLQHDLRDPHPVGAALELPGQVVAPGLGMPVEQRGCERGVLAGHPRILVAQSRSHREMSPLMVFRRTWPAPSAREPLSLEPGAYSLSRCALTPKQLLISPEKVVIS